MKQTEHNRSFTALDIQRYYAGELSMQERHAIEKAALDDPFLADALEGYQYTATPQADLSALQQRLAATTQLKRKGALFLLFQKPWIRVAALVLLLAGAGWSVYYLSFTSANKLAQSKSVTKPEVTYPAEPAMQERLNSPSLSDSNAIVTDRQYQRVKPEVNVLAASNKEQLKDNSEGESIKKEDKETDGLDAAKPTIKESSPAPVTETRVQREATATNIFRGHILDASGNGIPHANISVNGSNRAPNISIEGNGYNRSTVSNARGEFSLITTDSVVDITVAAPGFEANRILLRNTNEEEKVVLNEASLQEVVVTGYGRKSKRNRSTPATKKTAEVKELEPEGGWPRFNDYIAENLQIPEEVAIKKLTGEVELSFEVNKKGEPVNIKVERSLCESCDKEAVRILKEGPGWKKSKQRPGKVRIRF